MRSSYTVKNPHRDPNIPNERHINTSTEAFVVLDNLSIVDSSKWHTQKKFKHKKLFVGNQQECKQFVDELL